MMSLSSTVTILSIFSLTMSKVNFPGVFTEIPSAIVVFPLTVSSELLSSDFFIAGYALDSTPIIFTSGCFSLTAVIIPATKPPPPIGT